MALHTRPEPMNASPHHPKVKVSLTMSDPLYVAGGSVTGKMAVESRADKGLGLGVMMVELFAIEELISRDHSATSSFLHSRRLFQGQGLPPSNAVLPHPLPGDTPLPAHYHPARKGITTFLFNFPLPPDAPSAINFGSGLARVRYEVRASVAVAWKGERRLVTDKKEVDVVESCTDELLNSSPEAVVVGEGGKIWVQGRVVGGMLVAGKGACVELQVKNHSSKKNTGLTVTLTRHLHLTQMPGSEKSPLQISDTLTNVSFRGPEYVAQPGSEGVATLVFDVPKEARGLSGGLRPGDEEENRTSEALFEVKCIIGVKMAMGIGSKDIVLEIPITVLHPQAAPSFPTFMADPYANVSIPPSMSPLPPMSPVSFLDRPTSPYPYSMSPPIQSYMVPGQHPWIAPPYPSHTPMPYQYFSPPPPEQAYYYPPPPVPAMSPVPASVAYPPRSSSVEPPASQPLHDLPSGLPYTTTPQPALLPLAPPPGSIVSPQPPVIPEREEGKGERASRVSLHLRMSSRHRSASPPSHRHPLPMPPVETINAQHTSGSAPRDLTRLNTTQLSTSPVAEIHSPRPMPSPKHTVTVDPFTRLSLSKSERVEALEKMAEEANKQSPDMSGDIPRDAADEADRESPGGRNIDKTLPGPPVPTGKDKLSLASPRPRMDDVFSPLALPSPEPLPADQTPPTPTLMALSPRKLSSQVTLKNNEAGLDALERRLLEKVGTRKLEKEDGRMDVRDILQPVAAGSSPMLIPPKKIDGLDNVNDSAISSLTLTGIHDGGNSDEKTHQPLNGGGSGSHGNEEGRRESREIDTSRNAGERKSGERKGGKKQRQEKAKDNEMIRLRKAAKGRVAEWLGRIDPDMPPPPVVTPPPIAPDAIGVTPDRHATPPQEENLVSNLNQDSETKSGSTPKALSPMPSPNVEEMLQKEEPLASSDDTVTKDVNASPNPRSSGFVPICTYKARMAETIKSQRASMFMMASHFGGGNRSPDGPSKSSPSGENEGGKNYPHKLPVQWPPTLDREVKYDIRSARGGRGGKVTAITSLWSSATEANGVRAEPTKVEPPKPKRLDPAGVFKAAANTDSKPNRSDPMGQGTNSARPSLPSPTKGRPVKSTETSSAKPAATRSPFEHKNSSASDSPNLGELTMRRAKMIKSSSVPAVLSSSLAQPMLSSTASLVKPTSPVKPKSPIRLPPTISESPAETKIVSKPPGDLAFGQARLRDLIKKYQGQAT